MNKVAITFYGVRGSYPVASRDLLKFGGNTSSLLIETSKTTLILDAGTGLIGIGNYLKIKKNPPKKIELFITHLHSDHIQGLPFFEPVFDPETEINIYGSKDDHISFKDTIFSIFNHPFSPISNKGIKAKINVNVLNLEQPKPIDINNEIKVEYIKDLSHPLYGVLLYKLSVNNQFLVYATDIESPDGFGQKVFDFVNGADVLIHDCQYFDKDYFCPGNSRQGFGHSTVTMAAENALKCKVKKLYLFHYNPLYNDQQVEKMVKEARKKFKNTFLAKEGHRFYLRRE